MAATLVGENFAGRKTRYLKDFTREHTRVFIVVTSVNTDDGTVVAAASGVPIRGSVHPTDALAHCTDVLPTNNPEDPYQWSVECSYSTSMDDYQASPTSKPTIYDWPTEFIEKAMAVDLDAVDVVNSAQETLDPPASRKVQVDVIKATMTKAGYVPVTDKDAYVQHVNNDAVTCGYKLYMSGQLLCDDLHVSMVEELGVFYYRYDYTFKGRTDLRTIADFTLTANITASGSPQTKTVSGTTTIKVGELVDLYNGLSFVETVTITAVNPGVSFTAIFSVNHTSGETVRTYIYDPWQYQPLDMGFNTWDATNHVNREILTSDGNPIAHPVLLDGSGQRLATWASATPVRLKFRLIENVSMASLLASFP